jgi:hypothetical protein
MKTTRDPNKKPQKDVKVYEKPAIVYRQPLESVANACDEVAVNGKTSDDQCAIVNS